MVFDHFSTPQCGDSLLMTRSTLIPHVVFIRISHRLALKLYVLSNGVVDAFFEVSFYLGDGFCNIEILLRRWISLVLLWEPIDGRWLLFVSFYLDN
jgi:hypothetical protein